MHKIGFHNRQLFFGKYLRKLCSVKLISATTIFAMYVPYVHRRHRDTYVRVCVGVRARVVVRILRFDATARRHICRNIRLAHRTDTIATHVRVLSLSLATHTRPANIFALLLMLFYLYSVYLATAPYKNVTTA